MNILGLIKEAIKADLLTRRGSPQKEKKKAAWKPVLNQKHRPPDDVQQIYDQIKNKPALSLNLEEREFLTLYLDNWGYCKLERNCKDCYWWESGLPPGNPYGGNAVRCKKKGWLPAEVTGCFDFLIYD